MLQLKSFSAQRDVLPLVEEQTWPQAGGGPAAFLPSCLSTRLCCLLAGLGDLSRFET